MCNRLFLLFFCLVIGGCELFEKKPPHIFLISIDTLRWDYLASYGFHEKDVSPAIDRLAQNGTLFEQAVTSAGTTVPSHGTMLTGLYPRLHGARSNFHGLYPQTRTIAQALTEAGYRTAAMVSYQGIIINGELGRGFETVNTPFNHPDRARVQSGDSTLEQATAWLESIDSDSPIFMWMHIWEPHTPYEMTDRAAARLADYDGFLKDGVTTDQLRYDRQAIVDSEADTRAMRTIYSGEVNMADYYIGQFLTFLESRDLLDDSVIILVADHGQALAEHGNMGHGASHLETVIRVPLIITDFRDPEEQRISTRVGTIDIAPTIAELAGIESGFDWMGTSLLEPDKLDPERPYFAEVELRTSKSRKQNVEDWYDPDEVMVYSGEFKLVSRKGKSTLFETYIDSHTAMPIIGEKEILVLRGYLEGLIDEFRLVKLDLTEGEVSGEDLHQLQGLGYIQ